MTDQHPITPPTELVQQWRQQWACCPLNRDPDLGSYIANQAAQWGWVQRGAANEAELQQRADQELEACCEWLGARNLNSQSVAPCLLRAARRPKPPSLKEQALGALNQADEGLNESEWQQRSDTIRRALEALPND